MKNLRVRNLRSLKDTGNLNFKGLTILLGENSVGKSTVLRSFPLIKQSIETETTTPLLWFGTYVDFGSFKESVNRENSKEIIFNFSLELNDSRRKFFYRRIRQLNMKESEVEIHIVDGKRSYHNLDYINDMRIRFNNNSIEFKINNDGTINSLKINSEDYTGYFKDYKMAISKESIIPELVVKKANSNDNMYYYGGEYRQELSNNLISLLRNRGIEDEFVEGNFIEDKEEALEIFLNNSSLDEIIDKYRDSLIDGEVDKSNQVKELFIASNLEGILDNISRAIWNYYRNVYYIAPIRATAERYYRIQNLAVDKVDFQGRNIPVLLNSMSKAEYDKFNNWVFENFGFELETKGIEGHISINIIKENQIVNISDCGFGYSQILPIIVQLWLIVNDKSREKVTLLIEQPELHLHPKMQSDLIDAFINCIKIGGKLKDKINIIIETHSQTIIERVGYLIYKEMISPENVNIYLFEKNTVNETVVRKSNYDNNGYLENWPIGFFDVKED